MKRSSAFCFLTLALLAVLGSAFAQQPGRIPAVGVLITHAPLTDPVVESIRSGFRALGYEDGRNIRLAFVTAQGQLDRLPALAQQLVDTSVDAIIAPNEMSARAAQKVTSVVPIVMFAWSNDPVVLGLVASYAKPGGNMTGIYSLAADLEAKRLELIKQALPRVSRVAALSLDARLPAVAGYGEQVHAGFLMSYGTDIDDIYKRAAYFVDRLLKGAKASELPVEQVAKFKLAVNLSTAKALGITVSQSVLSRADEVIR